MTKIINAATEYIPLYNSEGAPLGIVEYKKKGRSRPRSVSTTSQLSSDFDDEEEEEEEESDGDSEEGDDGILHLLNLGTAPANNAYVARFDKDEKEQMYYSFFLLTVSRSFYNTFTPIIVSDGTHEKRELEIYLQCPTFEFANQIGFGPDVPMDMILESISKIRRFLKSLDMRASVGDPRFLEAVLNCPSLDFLYIQPQNFQDITETENIIRVCTVLMQRHQNIGCRGSAARTIAVKVCTSADLVGVHELMVKYDVVRIARTAFLRDKYNHPETFRDYLACLESIIVIENVKRRGVAVPLENVTPLSEFTEVIDYIDDIFENGDGRFLRIAEVMPFLLNFFVKIVTVPRLAGDPFVTPFGMRGQEPLSFTAAQLRQRQSDFHASNEQIGSSSSRRNGPPQNFYLHPCEQRKIDFARRYRSGLVQHLFDLITNVPTLCDPLDADIITRVFIIVKELLPDLYWCDYYSSGDMKLNSTRQIDHESWRNMIKAGRATLEHFPFESVGAIFTRSVSGEKTASSVFNTFVYIAGIAITYIGAHQFIDVESAIRVPLLLARGGPIIEGYAKLLLVDKDPDGEAQKWDDKYNIIHPLEFLYDRDSFDDNDDDPEAKGELFRKQVVEFYVTKSSVNHTLATFVLKALPEFEPKLFPKRFRAKLKTIDFEKMEKKFVFSSPKRYMQHTEAIDSLKKAANLIKDTEFSAGIEMTDVRSFFNDKNPVNVAPPKYKLRRCLEILNIFAERYVQAEGIFAEQPWLLDEVDEDDSDISQYGGADWSDSDEIDFSDGDDARAGNRRMRSGRAVRVGRRRTAGRVPARMRRQRQRRAEPEQEVVNSFPSMREMRRLAEGGESPVAPVVASSKFTNAPKPAPKRKPASKKSANKTKQTPTKRRSVKTKKATKKEVPKSNKKPGGKKSKNNNNKRKGK